MKQPLSLVAVVKRCGNTFYNSLCKLDILQNCLSKTVTHIIFHQISYKTDNCKSKSYKNVNNILDLVKVHRLQMFNVIL